MALEILGLTIAKRNKSNADMLRSAYQCESKVPDIFHCEKMKTTFFKKEKKKKKQCQT